MADRIEDEDDIPRNASPIINDFSFWQHVVRKKRADGLD